MLPRRVGARPGAGPPDAGQRAAAAALLAADGGAFVTLPQVYTEDAEQPGWRRSNLGMYRVQLSGNQYEPDREVGLHYQIHRGIGVHHAAAIRRSRACRVNVFVGGPPAMTLAAVMPLPEGLPELAFAGALAGRRVRLARRRRRRTAADARRRRLLHRRHGRSRGAQARRAVRRSPRLLQPGARLPGAAASSTSTTAPTRSGRSPSSAGRRRRTPCSARSSTS